MLEEDFGVNEKYDNLPEVLFGNLLRTADAIRRSTEALLKKKGVTLAQYNVIRSIRERGKKGAPIGILGTEMLTHVPDMTRLIDRMEKKNFVRRYHSLEDRRSILIQLTPKGLKVANDSECELVELHKQNFASLSKKDQQQLKHLLFRVRQNIFTKGKNNEN